MKTRSPQEVLHEARRVLAYLQRPRPERAIFARMLRKFADQVEVPVPKVAASTRVGAMSESEFWRVIETYGWGTKTTDYKAIEKDLMKRLSPDEAEDLQSAFRKLSGKLSQALNKVVDLGDDSFGDLVAHIIGMGRREYESVLKNPQLGAERARKYDYKESFAYALPHKQDYQSLNVSKYVTWADQIIASYTATLGADEDDVPWLPKIRGDLKKVVDVMEEFTRTKDIHALMDTEVECQKAAENIEKSLRRLNLGMTFPEEGSLEDALKTTANSWFVKNFFSDVKQYLL